MDKMITTIQDIANFIRMQGEKLVPLSEYEINFIENTYNLKFPRVYRDFLSLMGRGAGSFMKGSSVFYDELFDLKEGADELIQENDLVRIPDEAFVFWMHQGYQAAYFLTSDQNDPAVYFYSEGNRQNSFTKAENTLTNFFIIQLLSSYPPFFGE